MALPPLLLPLSFFPYRTFPACGTKNSWKTKNVPVAVYFFQWGPLQRWPVGPHLGKRMLNLAWERGGGGQHKWNQNDQFFLSMWINSEWTQKLGSSKSLGVESNVQLVHDASKMPTVQSCFTSFAQTMCRTLCWNGFESMAKPNWRDEITETDVEFVVTAGIFH